MSYLCVPFTLHVICAPKTVRSLKQKNGTKRIVWTSFWLNFQWGKLCNRRCSLSSDVMLKLLYKSLVRPHVEYCTPVWSPCYQKDMILIERVQHRFTRMISGFSKLSYYKRLELFGLWSLEERRNRADLIEVFKVVKGLSAMLGV